MRASALLAAPIPAPILRLVTACQDGRLTVCAGAGLSKAADASLPLGAELSELLSEHLDGRLAGYSPPADTADLVVVADAALAAAESLSTLQQEVLRLAPFLDAVPNLAHRALALLLAEGAVSATLLWNWDNCLERSAPDRERIEVALSDEDVGDLRVPAVLKVHGCATRRSSLLITSSQLAEQAPLWSDRALARALSHDVVVFVGIGDVADYARHRISQLLNDFESLDMIVVGPSVVSKWSETVWAEVAAELADDAERRVESTAETFFDDLLRAWAIHLLMALERLGRDEASMSSVVDLVIDALGRASSLGVVSWCRSSLISPMPGRSAVRSPQVLTVLLAAGVLARGDGDQMSLAAHARIVTPSRQWLAVVAESNQMASAIEREITRRAQRMAEAGLSAHAVSVLAAGPVIGGFAEALSSDVTDIFMGEVADDDIVAAPTAVAIDVTWADAVLGAVEQ
jgi:hypothetical protein